jgi:iron complex transport system substrate-binding protein
MTAHTRPPLARHVTDYPALTARPPERIVCLTEETTETLYLLGEQHRIVGISGYTVRPPQARKEKPRVSAFTSAKIDKILALEPDLVLGFSDLQADIAAQLIRHAIPLHVFNQRSVDGILAMIATLGALVGAQAKSVALIDHLVAGVQAVRQRTTALTHRPRVYFEEWDDPLISGIRWVAELIGIAGGDECFPEHAGQAGAKHRIIADATEVVRRAPDIIIGSWCGKKFQPEQVMQRPGWHGIPAVRHGHVYEIKSSDILQPGPAALTDGLRQLHDIILRWSADGSRNAAI